MYLYHTSKRDNQGGKCLIMNICEATGFSPYLSLLHTQMHFMVVIISVSRDASYEGSYTAQKSQ